MTTQQTQTIADFVLARIAEDYAERVTRFRDGYLPTPRELGEASRWEAQCKAHRAIVRDEMEWRQDGEPTPTLRALAAIWSDHEAYDEAWSV